MKRAFIDTPEGQIYYQTEGSGEPVLLLHKASLSSEEFSELLPLLGKNYRAIAMDVLGCGNSDQPKFVPRVEDYARNTIHFLDALKIEKINIAGRLFGASVAIEMAVTHPERVNKLILLDILHVPPEELQKVKNNFAAGEYRKLSSNYQILMHLIRNDGGGDWREINEAGPKIQAVTGADVKRVANKYFTRENRAVATYTRKAGTSAKEVQ